MELLTLTNTDPRFYRIMGPFLANRDVVKAVGGPIWDDDTKTWYVLKDAKKGVLGFCAVTTHNGRALVESLWTRPGLNRVASELVALAVERHGKTRLHAVVRHWAADAYTAAGFEVTATTKEFTRLTRPAGETR